LFIIKPELPDPLSPAFPNGVDIVGNNTIVINPVETIERNFTEACDPNGKQVIVIEFEAVHGDLPPVTADVTLLSDSINGDGNPDSGTISVFTDGASVDIYTSVQGTTENIVCNGRGLCNRETGLCECFNQWTSSDGKGGAGFTGDCGFRNEFARGENEGNLNVLDDIASLV
jgi:hypothetical protein